MQIDLANVSRTYLNTIVKDLLPDQVALLGRGHNIQESVGSRKHQRKLFFFFSFQLLNSKQRFGGKHTFGCRMIPVFCSRLQNVAAPWTSECLGWTSCRTKPAANICCLTSEAKSNFSDYACTVSPACEVHLITSQVNVAIGEHGADLREELSHEVVRGVQDGIHWPERARGFGPRVTGCEKIFLAWWEMIE